jgi:hypothetical protein
MAEQKTAVDVPIKALAIRQEDTLIRHNFTEAEKQVLREDFTKLSIQLKRLEEELVDFKANHKNKAEPVELRADAILDDLDRGYREMMTHCYLVDNQEDGVMEYYNEAGELVYTRPLTKTERQGNLQFETKR